MQRLPQAAIRGVLVLLFAYHVIASDIAPRQSSKVTQVTMPPNNNGPEILSEMISAYLTSTAQTCSP
jgi:hypothetical protein